METNTVVTTAMNKHSVSKPVVAMSQHVRDVHVASERRHESMLVMIPVSLIKGYTV